MNEKPRLGVHGAWYLKPLLHGLDRPDSPFLLSSDLPASVAIRFNDRPDEIRGAFLSPIDYARHGGQYCIVPGIAVSSSLPTNTIQLFVRQDRRNIETIAVDIRVTSEIILAKIILTERFPNLPSDSRTLQFVPMMPDRATMLKKADAALIVNDVSPVLERQTEVFSLDLVEEWQGMTELPYVHGMWVVREDHFSQEEIRELSAARDRGTSSLEALSSFAATNLRQSQDACRKYFDSFSYDLGPQAVAGLSEFFRYCFYHGVIGDIPEINLLSFDDSRPSPGAPID